MGIFKILKTIGKLILSAVVALFKSIVTISWGMASFFLLAGFVKQYNFSTEALSSLIYLQQFVTSNYMWFFWAFLLFYMWQDFLPLKEKEDKNVKSN